jgi:hypothetical protein
MTRISVQPTAKSNFSRHFLNLIMMRLTKDSCMRMQGPVKLCGVVLSITKQIEQLLGSA